MCNLINSKISIIIPVFNAENTIERCLNSLLQQTYHNYIIHVINDGSTDHTGEILENYIDNSKVIVTTLQERSGVSVARNTGIHKLKTEYVAFVDADDYVEKNYLENLYKNISSPTVDMSICSWIVAENNNNNKIVQGNRLLSAKEALKDIFRKNGPQGYLWNKLFRTRIILEHEITFDAEIHVAEDLVFCFKYLLYANNVQISSVACYNYVLSSNNVSNGMHFERGNINFYLSYLKALDKIVEILPSKNQSILIETRASICNVSCDLIRMINLNGLDYNTKEIRKNAKENSHFLLKSKTVEKKRIVVYYLTIYFPAIMKILDTFKFRNYYNS